MGEARLYANDNMTVGAVGEPTLNYYSSND